MWRSKDLISLSVFGYGKDISLLFGCQLSDVEFFGDLDGLFGVSLISARVR